jgi:hypothetical protein
MLSAKAALLVHVAVVIAILVPFTHGGIAGLSKYFRRAFPKAWHSFSTGKSQSPILVDHMCVDMNELLHVRSTENQKYILGKIFFGLTKLLKNVRPRKSLVIAFDGTAPYAKIEHQRISRREVGAKAIDSLITPGTDLMNKVEDVVIAFLLRSLNETSRFPSLQNVTVFISDSKHPGEGEMKILHWIKSFLLSEESWKESIVICGSDADIILQMLALTRYSNALVFQPSSHIQDSSPLLLLNASAALNLLIARLRNGSSLNRSLHGEYSPLLGKANSVQNPLTASDSVMAFVERMSPPQKASFCADMLVLFLFEGNDYLPSLWGTNIDQSIDIYVRIMSKLPIEEQYLIDIENNTFNFKALWLLVRAIHEASVDANKDSKVMPIPLWSCYDRLRQYAESVHRKITVLYGKKNRIVGMEFDGIVHNVTHNNISFKTNLQALEYFSAKVLHKVKPDLLQQFAEQVSTAMQEFDAMCARKQSAVCASSLRSASNATIQRTISQFSVDVNTVCDALEDGKSPLFGLTDAQYLDSVVLDEDIAHYLKGHLWVLQMYSDGECSDIGYSYGRRPKLTPLAIADYFERHACVADNVVNNGHMRINNQPYRASTTVGGNPQQPSDNGNSHHIELDFLKHTLFEKIHVPVSNERYGCK